MKQCFIVLFLVLSGLVCSAQSYKRIDFSKDFGDEYVANKLITHPNSSWFLKIDKLERTSGSAKTSGDGAFEIKGLKGDLSFILKTISIDKDEEEIISFDLIHADKNSHYSCNAIYVTDKLSFQKLSEEIGDCIVQTNYVLKEGNMELSIDFKNLKETDVFKIVNIDVHALKDEIVVVKDSTSSFYPTEDIADYMHISSSPKQKIFSFYIDDSKDGSDAIATSIKEFKILSGIESNPKLDVLLSNISIYKDSKLLTSAESTINESDIDISFGKDSLSVKNNEKSLIEIYADINEKIDLGLNLNCSFLLKTKSFILSNNSTAFEKDKELYSPLFSIIPPSSELKIVYENDFDSKSLEGLFNTETWKIDSVKLNNKNCDYFLRANGKGLKTNYFYTETPDLLFNEKDMYWSFSLKFDESEPSAYNKFCYFLFSDKKELSSSCNAYAVGVNMSDSDDFLKLYKCEDNKFVPIATTSLKWSEDMKVDIRVIRKAGGEWFLSYSDIPNSLNYKGTAKCKDDSYVDGIYSGLLFFNSSSRFDFLRLDNLKIAVLAEYIEYFKGYNFGSREQICLEFDDRMDLSSLANSSDFKLYLADDLVTINDVQVFNNESIKKNKQVEIYFPNVAGDYRLVFLHPKDMHGEDVAFEDLLFKYKSQGEVGDVIINEVLINPLSPLNKYVELYNKSDKDVHFDKLIYASYYRGCAEKMLTDVSIPAKSYILLCSERRDELDNMSKYAKAYGLNYFRLPMSHCSICLKSEKGKLIDSMAYSTLRLKKASYKEHHSYERVDPDGDSSISNWEFSSAKEGCTPGTCNQTDCSPVDVSVGKCITCNRKSINHDGVLEENSVIFSMSYPQTAFRFKVYVFDSKGAILYNYSDNILYQNTTEFKWKGIYNNESTISSKICCVMIIVDKENGEADKEKFIINIK